MQLGFEVDLRKAELDRAVGAGGRRPTGDEARSAPSDEAERRAEAAGEQRSVGAADENRSVSVAEDALAAALLL